ncbi:hypothetical protein IQ07DRAFT_647790 [Pyrenochaeta sp. DS3sAY3a]|nr:hypothetical protein IQ07DRAFT_647790 [Pyrenochaeta sp. DS3sAY3a]
MENSTQSSYFDFSYFSAVTGEPLALTATVNPSAEDIRWSVLYFFLQHGHFTPKHPLESLYPLDAALGIPKVPSKVYVYFGQPKVQHVVPPLAMQLILKERLHQWNIRMSFSRSTVVDPGQHDIIAPENDMPEASKSSDMLDPEQSRRESVLGARTELKYALHRTQISIGAAMLAYEKVFFMLGYLDKLAHVSRKILSETIRSGLPTLPSVHDYGVLLIRQNEFLEKGNDPTVVSRKIAQEDYNFFIAAEKFRIEVRKVDYDLILISSSFVGDIDWDVTNDSCFLEVWSKIYNCSRKIQPTIVRVLDNLQTTLRPMEERVAKFEKILHHVDPEELARWRRMTAVERQDTALQVLPLSNIEQAYVLAFQSSIPCIVRWRSTNNSFSCAFLILAIDRRNTIEEADQVAELATKFQNYGVVGFDLCGDPARGDFSIFTNAFAKAKSAGLKITLHFAEAEIS